MQYCAMGAFHKLLQKKGGIMSIVNERAPTTPDGSGKIRTQARTMETISRDFNETLRNIGFWVYKQCPATDDPIEQCNQCCDEEDETPLRVGVRPHNQNMCLMIKQLPKRIFEALENVGITRKSQKSRRGKINKYPHTRN